MICDRCGCQRGLEHVCLDALKAERDRYMAALEEIAKNAKHHVNSDLTICVAEKALRITNESGGRK